MYPIENIIRKLNYKADQRLNILLANDADENYISRLCELPHNFYLIEPKWEFSTVPPNLKLFTQGERAFDLAIAFDRVNGYQKGLQICNASHLPLIVVDMASLMLKVPRPFFTNVNVKPDVELLQFCGNVSVGSTSSISESWNSQFTNLSTTISIPATPFVSNGSKILLDESLPKPYIGTLPIKIDDRFTTNKEEVAAYLHLWQSPTPLMIDAMASRLPVITFRGPDMTEIMEARACIVVKDIKHISDPKFLEQLLTIDHLQEVLDNAQNFVKDNTYETFITKWRRVLQYTSRQIYIRGR